MSNSAQMMRVLNGNTPKPVHIYLQQTEITPFVSFIIHQAIRFLTLACDTAHIKLWVPFYQQRRS
jgi:hypothetical protein